MATVAALIPARGGSKSIPRKNIVPVGGKPLIAWTIEAALGSKSLDRVYVSTDDEEIAAVARGCGAEVPFLRPADLASDEAGSLGVALHALDWMAAHGGEPDYLLFLQPTSPLRTTEDIDAAIRLAEERRADAVIGVCEAAPHPWLARRISEEGVVSDFFPLAEKPVRRQEYPPAYWINGAIYLIRAATLRSERSFQPAKTLAYTMPAGRSLDIDTPLELRLVDLLLSHV